MLAGVCGGIAGRLGIDAVILRVLVVVLSFFGGAGVLLYALGWLLLPLDDGRGRSELEDAFDAHAADRVRHLLTVVGLVVVIAVASVWVLSGDVVPGVLVVLTAVALLVLARRETPGGPGAPGRSGPYVPAPGGGPLDLAAYGQADPAGYGESAVSPQHQPAASPPRGPAVGGGSSGAAHPTQPLATNPGGSSDEPPYAGSPPYYQAPSPVWPPPAAPPRDRSPLGLLTVSVTLLALGALAAVDLWTADVPGGAYVALALGMVALGLLVGAWFGRARGLIVLGLVLTVALVPAVVVDAATDDDWSELRRWGRAETVRFSPTTAAQIEPAYGMNSGQLVLDLRDVDFTGDDVTTSVDAGAGEVVVLLPADVDVTAEAAVDLGELDLLGFISGGFDLGRSITDLGSDGAGGGRLALSIDANVGRVEVAREAA